MKKFKKIKIGLKSFNIFYSKFIKWAIKFRSCNLILEKKYKTQLLYHLIIVLIYW